MRLKHVKTVTKPSGAKFHYLAVPGHKLIRLPDGDKAAPEFLMAYAAAMTKLEKQGMVAAPGSISAAVVAYQRSPAFGQMAGSTRDQRRRHLGKIEERWGKARIADLRDKHISADMAELAPHAANNRLKTWRGLLSWAFKTRLIGADPSVSVEKSKPRKSGGFTPWSREDVEAFRTHWPIDTPQRVALELLYWTAARASDAVRLGPGMVDKQGWLVFRQKKTGGEVAIPFERDLPAFAASMASDVALLHQAIARAPRHMTWLVTAFGKARSEKAFSSWFASAAASAGVVGKSAHGLRKARSQALAEAGATAHQIAAWTGHESLSEVQRYARAADKRRILSGPQVSNGPAKSLIPNKPKAG